MHYATKKIKLFILITALLGIPNLYAINFTVDCYDRDYNDLYSCYIETPKFEFYNAMWSHPIYYPDTEIMENTDLKFPECYAVDYRCPAHIIIKLAIYASFSNKGDKEDKYYLPPLIFIWIPKAKTWERRKDIPEKGSGFVNIGDGLGVARRVKVSWFLSQYRNKVSIIVNIKNAKQ